MTSHPPLQGPAPEYLLDARGIVGNGQLPGRAWCAARAPETAAACKRIARLEASPTGVTTTSAKPVRCHTSSGRCARQQTPSLAARPRLRQDRNGFMIVGRRSRVVRTLFFPFFHESGSLTPEKILCAYLCASHRPHAPSPHPGRGSKTSKSWLLEPTSQHGKTGFRPLMGGVRHVQGSLASGARKLSLQVTRGARPSDCGTLMAR